MNTTVRMAGNGQLRQKKIVGSAEKNRVGRGTGITGFAFGLIILSLP